MAGRMRGWLALGWCERAGLVLMALALPPIAAALRLFGYGRTRRYLERRSPQAGSRPATAAGVESARRLAAIANIAGRHGVLPATCLPQSLLVYWLLRRRGLNPDLRIGVRREGARLDAHAWLELDGVALAQGEIAHRAFRLSGSMA